MNVVTYIDEIKRLVRKAAATQVGGSEPVVTDIAVKDGTIAVIGEGLAGKDTIDADGAIVSLVWGDIHTHYDGQVSWDDQMNPSASRGVGAIVMGNCGVGFCTGCPGR